MATALDIRALPEVGEIGHIPVAMIRPFKGQPRKHFDEDSLRDLAESITTEGQRTPAWVMPVTGGYELIAGERRWRACRLGGIPTLICEVRNPESSEAQYIDSVMENFGRKDCTVIEAARAVKEVIRIRFGENPKWGDKAVETVARIFVRTPVWVYQQLSLLRLHPDVMALLEPPQKISTQVAIALAGLQPEMQVSLAKEIIGRGLRHKSALALVRNSGANAQRKRPRSASEDFHILARFVISLGDQAEGLISMPPERMTAMFAHRPAKDIDTMRTVLRRRIDELDKLEKMLATL